MRDEHSPSFDESTSSSAKRRRTSAVDDYLPCTSLSFDRPSSSSSNFERDHFVCKDGVPSLLDLSAKIVAENYSFECVEERNRPIPEPVQRRILFWSFPTNQAHIRLYSSPCCSYNNASSCPPVRKCSTSSNSNEAESAAQQQDHTPSHFSEGSRLLQAGCVEDALQIGFHLSGVVRSLSEIQGERTAFQVSASFDRCKITAVKCSCDRKDIHWCQHVVALTLYRIKHPDRVKLRLPISETLCRMDREQLQKLVQYLIADHHTQVLPTAQALADDILSPTSHINEMNGAPDPTAGPKAESEHSWFLDEAQVKKLVQLHLSNNSTMDQLKQLFSKVREMLKSQDENGPRLLKLVTEQFLSYPWMGCLRATTSYQQPVLSEKCLQLWDQLGALWVCVVLNPFCKTDRKAEWLGLLKQWSNNYACPLENGIHNAATDAMGNAACTSSGASARPRTVFHRAVDACRIQWTDAHLMNIIKGKVSDCASTSGHSDQLYSEDGHALWQEHVPTACARVDSLRCHGYGVESVRLAQSIVRSIKRWQRRNSGAGTCPSPAAQISDGWIGHPLDPINSLYDTLIAHSNVTQSDTSAQGPCHDDSTSDSITTSNLTLATELAIIALGQARKVPGCSYAKQKAARQEEALVSKLNELIFGQQLLHVLNTQTQILLKGGSWTGLAGSSGCKADVMPVHTLACFIFTKLLPHQPQLAYELGLRALIVSSNEDGIDAGVYGAFTTSFNLPSAQNDTQQSKLAKTLLLASQEDFDRLRCVLRAICAHMRNASLVWNLAQEIQHKATLQAEASVARQNLLNTALELGLQVLRLTVGGPVWTRQELVRWLVNCASNLSLEAVLSIVTNWDQLFTPVEACGTVALMLAQDTVVLQLKLDKKQKEELANAIQLLAHQCAVKNPAQCALHALTLCESCPQAFDHTYKVVISASQSNCMPPQELFNIARHMEQRGHSLKAYEMTLLGLAHCHIGYSDEASPLVTDIYWACWLADRLGTHFLDKVIEQVIKNVKCATVLSAILRGLALGSAGMASLGAGDASVALMTSGGSKRKHPTVNNNAKLQVAFDKPPLNGLLNAAVAAYVNTVHSRLSHISPRHYGEFLDFLGRAKDTFSMAPEGDWHFKQMLENMKLLYKGKKKLMTQVSERFSL